MSKSLSNTLSPSTSSVFALIALCSTSLLSACTSTLNQAIDESVCEVQLCTASGDVDGDGALDCQDTDLDGDGLRNTWDAAPSDDAVAEVLPGGLGTDGALVVDSAVTLDVERTLLVGSAKVGSKTLSVVDGSLFAFGDEILVMSAQGEGAGTRAFAYVSAVDGNTLSIEPPIAADIAGDVVLVQRVPNYSTVEIQASGTLSAPSWDGEGGGVLALRATGAVHIEGAVLANAAGFTGAEGVASYTELPYQGESWTGLGASVENTQGTSNEGGGGAALGIDEHVSPAASGGGGAYGSDGDYGRYEDDNLASADGGWAYGDPEQSQWFFGSGGGAGAPDYFTLDGQRAGNVSGGGGAGGGLVMIFSEERISVSGTLSANGQDGEAATSVGAELGGGGGGAGGQITLGAPDLVLDASVTALGGAGGSAARSTADGKDVELVCENEDTSDCVAGRGGLGGDGRIRLDRNTAGGQGVVMPDPYLGAFLSPERFPCDADGDGVLSAACLSELTPGSDCDDQRADVFPGANEVEADGIDQDCDGEDTCQAGVVVSGGLLD